MFLYLVVLPISNSATCKMKFTGHWLRYSTTPNVTTIFTESSQAIQFAFIFLAANLTCHCLFSNSADHKKSFHINLSVIVVIAPNKVPISLAKCAEKAYPIQYDNILAVNIHKDYKLGAIRSTKSQQ